MMKKIILLILTTVNIFSWEINTHRAIERKAIEASDNLKTFVKNSGISTNTIFYNNERFEGYHKDYTGDYTYLDYVENGESNGISDDRWTQEFPSGKPSYQKMIEAGSILEDAQWSHPRTRGDGRFVNHFYDAQDGGRGLLMFGLEFQSVLSWATVGTGYVPPIYVPTNPLVVTITNVSPLLFSDNDNDYDYGLALEYFKLAFTSSEPDERRRYQAKMLVSVGQLMHFMNDMTSPAHTRNDAHPLGDDMEKYGRGGEDGDVLTGFRIKGNSVKDYLGLLSYSGSITLPKIQKYSKFSDFITKESTWTATHFFSRDTIFTKPLPSVSDTYESFASSTAVIDKYYIKSYGNGTNGCSNGCVPTGTKLGIRIKSYIINALKERYYNGSSSDIVLDKTATFRGDQTVLEENARILIPRAIANARNFLDYFFRGQIEAKIDGSNITIKNISDPSLVKDGHTATLRLNGTFRFKYTIGNDDTLHDFEFKRDWDRAIPNIVSIGEGPFSIRIGFVPLYSLAPGESIVVAIKRDTSITSKNIVVIYDGIIGDERGLAVCAAQTPGIMAN